MAKQAQHIIRPTDELAHINRELDRFAVYEAADAMMTSDELEELEDWEEGGDLDEDY